MGEETSDRDESQEVEEHRDDLELPDETAEEVTGGGGSHGSARRRRRRSKI